MGTSHVALVTGSAGGIGSAICASLHASGWLVAGIDQRPGGAVDLALQTDVCDDVATTQAVHEAEARLGPLEAVVTAAGHYEMTAIGDIRPEQWTRMMNVHLGGTVNVIRASLPGMVKRRCGAIVAITSELALGGGDSGAHYAAAKGAVIGLVRGLAVEVAFDGVRVNAVAPGPTDTQLLAPDSPWRNPDYLATLPLRRLAQPDEVARAVLYLIEEGTFCVGEVLSPNSGAVI